MLRCPNCGFTVTQGDQCPECFAQIKSDDKFELLSCMYCASVLKSGEILCRECGTSQIVNKPLYRVERTRSYLSSGASISKPLMFTTSTKTDEIDGSKNLICHISIFRDNRNRVLTSICKGQLGSPFQNKPIIEKLDFSYPDLKQNYQKLLNEISTNTDIDTSFDRLKSFSENMFDFVFPSSIKQEIKEIPENTHVSFLVDEEFSLIPWEFIDIFREKDAILMNCPLGRIVLTNNIETVIKREPHDEISFLILMGPDNLKDDRVDQQNPYWDITENLVEDLTKTLLQRGAKINIIRWPESSKKNILKEILSGEYDIIHYIGHGDLVKQGKDELTCLIVGKENVEFITPQDIDHTLSKTSSSPFLFFAHACKLGQQFEHDYKADHYLGLASPFIKNNVIFIGSLWEVTESGSDKFVRTVYDNLFNYPDKSIGETVLLARHSLIRENFEKVDNLDWLAFTLNGDPLSKMNLN